MDIRGKTALVTGASRGLGFAVAELLARRGVHLVIAARHADDIEKASLWLRQYGPVESIVADISEDAEAVVDRGVARFGHIDVLINNASELGPSPMPRLADLPWQAMERILRVNVTAALHLTQLVLPGMLKCRSGTIVNVSSDAGVNAYPGWGGYGASKAALEHVSRTLGVELDGSGVRVLAVDPGDMDTQMHRDAEPGVDLSHLAKPEVVAPALVALLEDERAAGRYELQSLLAEAR
jgi:NAD(P)-dependent dehydrogenase (short-subunit alcohol dehydrogenase family)